MATELIMSNSRDKTYRRCQNQYRYKYIMKLRPKVKKVPLELGSWMHELQMVHYDGYDWRERHEELTEAFNSRFEEEREELGDLPSECFRLMRSYLKIYEEEDSLYHTVDTEMDEVLTLPNGLKFRFIIDRIYEDTNGMLWLQDHKWVKKFRGEDYKLMEAQLPRYFWCAKKMGYTPLAGVELNECRKKAPTVPPLTKTGKISMAKKYDTDYWTFLAAIKRNKLDPEPYKPYLRRLKADRERFFKRTRWPVSNAQMKVMMKELVQTAGQIERSIKRNEFPRTTLTSCPWDCDYLDICVTELQGGDAASVIKHGYYRDRSGKED